MVHRILAASIVIATSPCFTPARSADEPTAKLRYSLKPGREFSYHTEAASKKGGGRKYIVDWKIWSIAREPDGSWRLVIRCDLSTEDASGPKSTEKESKDTLVWHCRMLDDGRLIGATTMGTVRDPFRLFPRLPDGPKDLESGWDSAGPEEQSVALHHRLTPGTKARSDLVSISTSAEGPEDKVYLSSHLIRATFDKRRGAVTRVETEDNSEHLSPGALTRGVTELVAIKDRGDEWAATFGKEAGRYFAAVDAYDEANRSAIRDAARCKKILADSKAALEDARNALTTPVLREAASRKLDSHDRSAAYVSEETSARAERIGKVATAWEAKDIDGKPTKLSDYRGKVVVMDFWYRNCGWCIHAMPQVARLSEEFRNQPVAVLGMCTDEKEADARAVIDAMGLKYPTIKAAGIPEKYGVQGFPTLIVVDRRGLIREIHVGYSPRLCEELSGVIRKLLAE